MEKIKVSSWRRFSALYSLNQFYLFFFVLKTMNKDLENYVLIISLTRWSFSVDEAISSSIKMPST